MIMLQLESHIFKNIWVSQTDLNGGIVYKAMCERSSDWMRKKKVGGDRMNRIKIHYTKLSKT